LAVIPPPVQVNVQEPVPQSILPFFPNHLAYRASSLLPPPARFVADQPETMDELSGENVDIVTIIRMPGQTWPTDREVEESQEVVREWGGVELGISRMEVIGPKAGR
jgi:hypothetical protein